MLLDAIHTRLDSLSRSEKKVAVAVLQNPQSAIAGNITALAQQAQVSEPTVIRFCRALDCEGWQEFKLKLAQGLAVALPGANASLHPADSASAVIDKICSRSLNALLDVRNTLDPKKIEKALDILAHARKVEFYGQGASGMIAADAQHQFFRSGISSTVYTDPHIHSIAASLLNKGDVVIVISQRGQSTALLHSVQLARKAGADIIALTPSGTPLAHAAHVLVPIDISVDIDPYTPLSARLAHLTVIDILAVGLALRQPPAFRKKMQHVQKKLQRLDVQTGTLAIQTTKSAS